MFNRHKIRELERRIDELSGMVERLSSAIGVDVDPRSLLFSCYIRKPMDTPQQAKIALERVNLLLAHLKLEQVYVKEHCELQKIKDKPA